MARQPPQRTGTSRIRFIMLDAEIPEGDLSQITSAIQNALKPATTVIQQRLPPTGAVAAISDETGIAEADLESENVEAEPAPRSESARPSRDGKPRKPVSMEVLDIDLTSEPSFASFAATHVPKNDTERNLVALAWFKQDRPGIVVTANHIYTCYRAMKWPSGIDDFPSILRSLKKNQLVKSVGRGEYEINHIGVARVEAMGSNA